MMARFLSPVLSAQVIKPTPTLILNLTSSRSLSWSSSCPSPRPGPCLQSAVLFSPTVGPLFPGSGFSFLPAVGPLFSHAGGSCWCCFELLFVLDCPGPVSAPRRRHLRAPNSHYLCNIKPWLRQGLGCPRADPHTHHRTFSHVPRRSGAPRA